VNIALAMTPLYEGVNIMFTCYMSHLLSGFIVATDAQAVKKQSHYRLGQALRVPGDEAPRFDDIWHM
jgi:hypothetical protein